MLQMDITTKVKISGMGDSICTAHVETCKGNLARVDETLVPQESNKQI